MEDIVLFLLCFSVLSLRSRPISLSLVLVIPGRIAVEGRRRWGTVKAGAEESTK